MQFNSQKEMIDFVTNETYYFVDDCDRKLVFREMSDGHKFYFQGEYLDKKSGLHQLDIAYTRSYYISDFQSLLKSGSVELALPDNEKAVVGVFELIGRLRDLDEAVIEKLKRIEAKDLFVTKYSEARDLFVTKYSLEKEPNQLEQLTEELPEMQNLPEVKDVVENKDLDIGDRDEQGWHEHLVEKYQMRFDATPRLLTDVDITYLSEKEKMIRPFKKSSIKADHRGKVISYGTSSVGYDSVLSYDLKRSIEVRNEDGSIKPLDPKKPDDGGWEDIKIDPNSPSPRYVLMPGELILSHTREYFVMPDNVMAICLGKSTYARSGIIVNVTPLEPGWEGHVTLEIHNASKRPVVLYPGEGICQFLFLMTNRPSCTYRDRKGKYQGQKGINLSKV